MGHGPCLVVLATPGKDGRDIIKGILETECLPEPTLGEEGVECWEWRVENKYYTATVQLAVVVQPEQCLSWILENGEALLLYCDALQNDALEKVNSLVEKAGHFEPDVQLLVCDTCAAEDNTAALSALRGQQWCISNGWELVELFPQLTPLEDLDEDNFSETWGFKRIRQALHAHTWSNLTMKDNQGSRLSAVFQSVSSLEENNSSSNTLDGEEVLYTQLADMTLDAGSSTTANPEMGNTLDPSLLEDYFGQGDGDFENLFSSFEHLKRTAAALPPDQRRDYAEKVAVAFWRAMGGDEEEVDGLDSD